VIRGWTLVAILAAVLVVGSPWIAYYVGLWNVEGTPAPPLTPHVDAEQMEFLHVALRKAGVFKVEPMSPLDWVLARLQEPEKLETGGLRATEIVAADWTSTRTRRAELRRLSETAMTIWLTQNWKTDEILLRAYQIEQFRALPKKR